MTDHLPECPCKGQNSDYIVCICDRLRACEQRVLREELLADIDTLRGTS
jgi:hypothetical protein